MLRTQLILPTNFLSRSSMAAATRIRIESSTSSKKKRSEDAKILRRQASLLLGSVLVLLSFLLISAHCKLQRDYIEPEPTLSVNILVNKIVDEDKEQTKFMVSLLFILFLDFYVMKAIYVHFSSSRLILL